MSLIRKSRFVEIANDVQAGPDCRVWGFTTILPKVRLGARCVIGAWNYLGTGAVLGDDVHTQQHVAIANGAVIGNRVFLGPHATLLDDLHPRVNNADWQPNPPTLEDDVSIGAGALIMPGVRVGANAVIGAGAVVTKDVPAGQTWAGNPARLLRQHRLRTVQIRPNDLGEPEWVEFEPCTCRACAQGMLT